MVLGITFLIIAGAILLLVIIFSDELDNFANFFLGILVGIFTMLAIICFNKTLVYDILDQEVIENIEVNPDSLYNYPKPLL